MIIGRTPLHEIVRINWQGLTAVKYHIDNLAPHVRLFRGSVGPDFLLIGW